MIFIGLYVLNAFLMNIKCWPMTSHFICIKMTSPWLKKLVTKFFLFFMLQTINPTTETKMIMKFPRGSHFLHKASH